MHVRSAEPDAVPLIMTHGWQEPSFEPGRLVQVIALLVYEPVPGFLVLPEYPIGLFESVILFTAFFEIASYGSFLQRSDTRWQFGAI